MRLTASLLVIFFTLIVSECAKAQLADTVYIKIIDISGNRSKIFSKGNMVTPIDSSTRAFSPHQNMAELLSANTSAFIKSYSPGGSATISARGTEARHNAVLWNGFNINSSSLGLCDLSMIPSFISDQVSIVEGGSGPVNGNSALGSTIILENNIPEFHHQNILGLNLETGSFGNYHGSLNFLTGSNFILSKSIVFYEEAENNFEFINSTHREKPEVKQNNASYNNYGFLQNLDFKLNKNSLLSAGIWYQVYNRELPPLMTSTYSYASQRDSILRTFVNYKKEFNKSVLKIKGAYFSEFQFYDDTKLNYHNKYKMTSYLSEAEWRVFLHEKIIFNSGISYLNSSADFAEYENQMCRATLSVFTGILYQPIHNWTINLNLRKEFTNIENPPVSPSLGLEGVLIKNSLLIFGNIGRHYNLPSMNDLFWNPGGNEFLKPEDAWSEELGLTAFSNNTTFPKITVTFFNSLVDNWIKWLPDAGGIYTPDNLRQVHISGMESALNYNKSINKLILNFNLNYTWCKSSISKINSPTESATVDKQLMYVPEHVFNFVATATWKKYSLQYNHTITGLRYTTADNTSSLDAFQVANLTVERNFAISNYNFQIYGKVLNLYNETYQVMAYRPMPGRWFSAGVKINFTFKNQK